MHHHSTGRLEPRMTSRRIPRPWLAEHHHIRPHVHPLHHDFRYTSPYGGPYGQPYMIPDQSMDLLQEKEWKVSWNKLSCCFCMRSQQADSLEREKSASQDVQRRRSHYDNVPFPAFPILRRNSSTSLMEDENEIYASDGYFSSFTESDTSSSDGDLPPKNTISLHDPEQRERAMSLQPESIPLQTPQKPVIVANRSHSAGPTNKTLTSSFYNQSFNTPVRNRTDTGDFSKHSGTTNTSRHRRNSQFQFSPQSIGKIWQGASEAKLPFPSYVLCASPSSQIQDAESGYISSLDDSETEFGASLSSLWDESDGKSASKHRKKLSRRSTNVANTRRGKGERPPKSSRRRGRLPPKQPSNRQITEMIPAYLPKSLALEAQIRGKIVVSGWVAALFDESMEERLTTGSKRISSSDIFYLCVVDAGDNARILMQPSDTSKKQQELCLRGDWLCESREISSRIGRSVNIRSNQSKESIANILPVSLDGSFFKDDKFVDARQFSRLHEQMFVSGSGRVYAPDEQHDAAMFIMFSLDALIKKCY